MHGWTKNFPVPHKNAYQVCISSHCHCLRPSSLFKITFFNFICTFCSNAYVKTLVSPVFWLHHSPGTLGCFTNNAREDPFIIPKIEYGSLHYLIKLRLKEGINIFFVQNKGHSSCLTSRRLTTPGIALCLFTLSYVAKIKLYSHVRPYLLKTLVLFELHNFRFNHFTYSHCIFAFAYLLENYDASKIGKTWPKTRQKERKIRQWPPRQESVPWFCKSNKTLCILSLWNFSSCYCR